MVYFKKFQELNEMMIFKSFLVFLKLKGFEVLFKIFSFGILNIVSFLYLE